MPIIAFAYISSCLAFGTPALAASTDVVFKDGPAIPATSGCTDWNPLKDFYLGTLWVPVTGSTNGPDCVITFRQVNGTAEGYLDAGVFTSTFKAVHAHHVYTRVGTYDA
jgi:hypothetical protein